MCYLSGIPWCRLNANGTVTSLEGVAKKFGESYQKTNKTEYANKISLSPFKIVAIRYNTRLTVRTASRNNQQRPPVESIAERLSHDLPWYSRPQNMHLWWPPYSGETGKSPQEPDQGYKKCDQAQLPYSEPGIGIHGPHCMKGHCRGAEFIFQFCATLAEPAG